MLWDFSDPVTMLIRTNMDDALETFIHEMSHQILYQNKNRIRFSDLKFDNPIAKKYKSEHRAVTNHILPMAISYKTYLQFYGKEKTHKIIEAYNKEGWKWHYKAWQIALKEGPDKIIKAYVR